MKSLEYISALVLVVVALFVDLPQYFGRGRTVSLDPASATARANMTFKPSPVHQFILFGDSLFQHSSSQERGYTLAPALQAEYVRRLDVVNRGFSGYNTEQALKLLPHVIPDPQQAVVRFLVILFGANDSCLKSAPGDAASQHVPLDRYKQNLRSIINHPAVKKQSPRIILVSPPPINEYVCEEMDRAKGFMKPRRQAAHTKLYAEAARQVAAEQDVTLLDLYSVFLRHAGGDVDASILEGSKDRPQNHFLRMLLHDGLHFTNVAYTLFLQELMRIISEKYPDQMPAKLPFVFPVWNDPNAIWPEE